MNNNNFESESLEKEFREYAEMQELIELTRGAISIGTFAEKAFKLAKKTENVELINAIADLRLEAASLKGELASAREKILELEKKAQKPKLIAKDGIYAEEGNEQNVYCPACTTDSNRVLLQKIDYSNHYNQMTSGYLGHNKYNCPKCKERYGKVE